MKKIVLLFCLLVTCLLSAEEKEWGSILKEDGIEVFALKSDSQSGVIPFKATGLVEASLERVFEVMKDDLNKPKWSPKLDKVKIHKKLAGDKYIFSEYYRTPWPAKDREFLLAGEIRKEGNDLVEFIAKSVDNSYKNKSYIQTDVYFLKVSLRRIAVNRTQVSFAFHGDMKGWMPVWLMNLIQKKWPLRFIQGLRKAAVGNL